MLNNFCQFCLSTKTHKILLAFEVLLRQNRSKFTHIIGLQRYISILGTYSYIRTQLPEFCSHFTSLALFFDYERWKIWKQISYLANILSSLALFLYFLSIFIKIRTKPPRFCKSYLKIFENNLAKISKKFPVECKKPFCDILHDSSVVAQSTLSHLKKTT